MLYHTPFLTAEALTQNTNRNVTRAYCIFGDRALELSDPEFSTKDLEVDFYDKSNLMLQITVKRFPSLITWKIC